MTDRKPPGVGFGSWVERQIRRAQQEGEFDGLALTGRPLPDIDQPHDELWWLKKKLKAEGVSYLPPTLAIRKDVEDTLERIAGMRSEPAVRRAVEELNTRIRTINRTGAAGPPSTTVPLDVDAVVRDWRAAQAT